MQIGAQLYTVREFTKNPGDLAETLHKIAAIGYKTVQSSAVGPIDPHAYRELLDKYGLTLTLTHVPPERVLNDLDALIKEHKILGCENMGIGGMDRKYRGSAEGIRAFAADFDPAARKLAEHGMRFFYHNHIYELERFAIRLTALELLAVETCDNFHFTLDLCWIAAGGGDPAQFIETFRGRSACVHFKDLAVYGGKAENAEVMTGNLNWPKIIAKCLDCGVEFAFVEQDTCRRDPFESLALSYRNLKSGGLVQGM